MATYTSKQAGAARPAISSAEAGDTMSIRGEIDLAVDVGGALALNDVLNLVKLPPDHVPVDFIADSDDLDTNATPLISIDFGVGGGNEFIAASQLARAGGIDRMNKAAGLRVAATSADRYITAKVVAAPATGATTGKIGGTLFYRAK